MKETGWRQSAFASFPRGERPHCLIGKKNQEKKKRKNPPTKHSLLWPESKLQKQKHLSNNKTNAITFCVITITVFFVVFFSLFFLVFFSSRIHNAIICSPILSTFFKPENTL